MRLGATRESQPCIALLLHGHMSTRKRVLEINENSRRRATNAVQRTDDNRMKGGINENSIESKFIKI